MIATRFNNGRCTGNNGNNGTCYTSVECSEKGGAAAGSCAAGYGVCCTCKLQLQPQAHHLKGLEVTMVCFIFFSSHPWLWWNVQ